MDVDACDLSATYRFIDINVTCIESAITAQRYIGVARGYSLTKYHNCTGILCFPSSCLIYNMPSCPGGIPTTVNLEFDLSTQRFCDERNLQLNASFKVNAVLRAGKANITHTFFWLGDLAQAIFVYQHVALLVLTRADI